MADGDSETVAKIVVEVDTGNSEQSGQEAGRKWKTGFEQEVGQTQTDVGVAGREGEGGEGGSRATFEGKGAVENAQAFLAMLSEAKEKAKEPGEALGEGMTRGVEKGTRAVGDLAGVLAGLAGSRGGVEGVVNSLGQIATAATGAGEALGAIKAGVAVAAIAEVGKAAVEVSQNFASNVEELDAWRIGLDQFRQATGETVPDILKMSEAMERVGISFGQFENIQRSLSVRQAALRGPLARAVESEADQTTAAALHVQEARQSQREAVFGEERAGRAAQYAAAEADITARFAPRREELEGQQSQLGVEQAVEGERGARLNLARAGIRRDLAPARQQLADEQGPLTVAGASASAEEARFQLEESRGVAPWREQQINERRQRLRQEQLERNVTQAEAREKEARLGETERQEEEGLPGGGVVGGAEAAFRQAQLAERGAQLGVTGAQLGEEERGARVDAGLGATRQVQEASDKATEAQNAYAEAINRVAEASLQVSGAQRAQRDLPYGQPGAIARQIMTGQGDIDLNAVDAGTLAQAVSRVAQIDPTASQMGPNATMGALARLRQYPGLDEQSLLLAESGLGIPRQQQVGFANILGRFGTTEGLRDYFDRPLEGREGTQEQAFLELFRGQGGRGVSDSEARNQFLLFTENQNRLSRMQAGDTQFAQQQFYGLGGFSMAFSGAATGLASVATNAEAAAAGLARLIEATGQPAPQRAEGGGGQPASMGGPFGGNAEGGYIRGPGTETSDSIPAPWLSDGEFVVKASRVKEVGLPFLEAVNRDDAGPQEIQHHLAYAHGGAVMTGDRFATKGVEALGKSKQTAEAAFAGSGDYAHGGMVTTGDEFATKGTETLGKSKQMAGAASESGGDYAGGGIVGEAQFGNYAHGGRVVSHDEFASQGVETLGNTRQTVGHPMENVALVTGYAMGGVVDDFATQGTETLGVGYSHGGFATKGMETLGGTHQIAGATESATGYAKGGEVEAAEEKALWGLMEAEGRVSGDKELSPHDRRYALRKLSWAQGQVGADLARREEEDEGHATGGLIESGQTFAQQSFGTVGGYQAGGAVVRGLFGGAASQQRGAGEAIDAAEAAATGFERTAGATGAFGIVQAADAAGDREAMADPHVREQMARSDERKASNIHERGWMRGSWENLKESVGFAMGGPVWGLGAAEPPQATADGTPSGVRYASGGLVDRAVALGIDRAHAEAESDDVLTREIQARSPGSFGTIGPAPEGWLQRQYGHAHAVSQAAHPPIDLGFTEMRERAHAASDAPHPPFDLAEPFEELREFAGRFYAGAHPAVAGVIPEYRAPERQPVVPPSGQGQAEIGPLPGPQRTLAEPEAEERPSRPVTSTPPSDGDLRWISKFGFERHSPTQRPDRYLGGVGVPHMTDADVAREITEASMGHAADVQLEGGALTPGQREYETSPRFVRAREMERATQEAEHPHAREAGYSRGAEEAEYYFGPRYQGRAQYELDVARRYSDTAGARAIGFRRASDAEGEALARVQRPLNETAEPYHPHTGRPYAFDISQNEYAFGPRFAHRAEYEQSIADRFGFGEEHAARSAADRASGMEEIRALGRVPEAMDPVDRKVGYVFDRSQHEYDYGARWRGRAEYEQSIANRFGFGEEHAARQERANAAGMEEIAALGGRIPEAMQPARAARPPAPQRDLSVSFESLPRSGDDHPRRRHLISQSEMQSGEYSLGGLGGRGYAEGGFVSSYTPSPMPLAVTGPGAAAERATAHHVLDLRTDAGVFPGLKTDDDVLDSIRQSAISARLTTTGAPSWRT